MPIFADSRNDVTAARAPAAIEVSDIPLKKFLTDTDRSRKPWQRAERNVKITEFSQLVPQIFTNSRTVQRLMRARLELSVHGSVEQVGYP